MTVHTEFEPGVTYVTRVGAGGQETRTAKYVEYGLATAMLEAAPKGYQGIPDENGAFDFKVEPLIFDLFGGKAKVINGNVDPAGVCMAYVRSAVAEANEWSWLKLSVRGGDFDGISCLGIHRNRREAVVVRVDP